MTIDNILLRTKELPFGDLLADEALKYLGDPASNYKGPELGILPATGFDCSGFVVFLLKKLGIDNLENIRHTSEFFDKYGIFVHYGLHQRGDLVFFSKKGLAPKHIGIVIDENYYIHSPGKNGSVIEIKKLVLEPINTVTGAIYNTNPIGFKRHSINSGRWQNFR